MRVVGVIDLRQGEAVHARGGRRSAYQPVPVPGNPASARGDAAALACFYRDQAHLADVYVADLDAIAGRPWHDDAIASIAATIPHLWLDAAIATAADAQRARRLGARRIVIGLETLRAFDDVARIAQAVGDERVVLSLDLRDGRTVASRGALPEATPAADAAARAADAGARTLVVLDLARVGSSGGCDLATLRSVRKAAPDVALFAGGGVRDAGDLIRLREAGCEGALVATALLSGALKTPLTSP